ncbi:hypothetical protein BHE74_00031420 [Ensete ventricosum]|nr:hypothetical protein BHE74_00031420 [Ensete ventricosum]
MVTMQLRERVEHVINQRSLRPPAHAWNSDSPLGGSSGRNQSIASHRHRLIRRGIIVISTNYKLGCDRTTASAAKS